MPLRPICFSVVMSIAAATAAHADGRRVEFHAGYDRLDHPGFFSPSDSTFQPTDGPVYGVGIGYDFPVGGKVFVGIEGNVDFSSHSRCQVNPLILAPGIFESCLKPGRDLGANARLGVKLGDGGTRLYGLVGYSNLKLDESFRINRQVRTPVGSDIRDGLRVGVGLEQSFGDRLYGRIEYRFSDNGGNINRNQGLVGVGLRF